MKPRERSSRAPGLAANKDAPGTGMRGIRPRGEKRADPPGAAASGDEAGRAADGDLGMEIPRDAARQAAREGLRALSDLLSAVADESAGWMAEISSVLVRCFSSGSKVLCCGNGGSASQADHAAAELAGKFYQVRKGLPAVSLTGNIASLTALSNDFGYDKAFAKQVEGLGGRGDVLLAFTTSGRSPNIREAVSKAKEMGLITVGFTGQSGTDFSTLCDYCLVVPSSDTPRVQEVHLAVAHGICALAEAALFERR